MSAVETRPMNIAETLRTYGGAPVGDLEETVRAIESTQAVMFAFHTWIPFPNFGSEGFKFNIQHTVLERLTPIYLPVYPKAVIVPRFAPGQFAVGGVAPGAVTADGSIVGGSIPSRGSAAKVAQVPQLPAESLQELLTAYGRYGMVGLHSLSAQTPQETRMSFALFEGVMGAAQSEEEDKAGRRPEDLLLEDFPVWLERGAPRALEYALSRGANLRIPIFEKQPPVPGMQPRIIDYRIEHVSLGSQMEQRGHRLITEVYQSVRQAHEMALNPSDGILPRTKELLDITANKGQGGKNHLDGQDEWLMRQFPSFSMDTSVERAQKALQGVLAESGQSQGDTQAGILALLEKQGKTIDMLTEIVVSQKKTGKA